MINILFLPRSKGRVSGRLVAWLVGWLVGCFGLLWFGWLDALLGYFLLALVVMWLFVVCGFCGVVRREIGRAHV